MDTKLGTMESLFLSEDRESVENWKYNKEKSEENTQPKKEKIENSFQNVFIEFQRTMESFQKSARFMMVSAPLMRRIGDTEHLRGFARKHGVELQTGEYELYQIGIEHISEISRRLQSSSSVAQGIKILPRLFMLGLISAYDVFLSNLIRTILLKKPEILSSSEKNFSFKDLLEIGSIEAARERMIEKEVETVIRSSHAAQIRSLEKTLSMTLTKDLKIWPDFIEICERRNLITHTGGIISSQYISVCKEHGVDVSARSVGDELTIDQKYYVHAVSVILEMGIKLTQVIWRKLEPSEIELAATELNEFAYKMIVDRRYKLAAEILEFGLQTSKKTVTEAIRKNMIVNYANAVKLGGNKLEAERIIDAEDWSAATDVYKLCVAAVKDDVDQVVSMMEATVRSGGLEVSAIRDWPVFEKVRSDSRFVDVFEKAFGEKLILDKETKSTMKAKDEDENSNEVKTSLVGDEARSDEIDLSGNNIN
jgi:hypothetical protein